MRPDSDGADNGTTLLSALVAVLVLTLVVATGARFVVQTAGTAIRQRERALYYGEAARLDDALINELGRVVQPLSLAEPDIVSESGLLKLGWYRGDPDSQLVLAWDGGGVTLSTPESTHHFRRISVESAEVDPDPVWHLRLVIAPRPGGSAEPALGRSPGGRVELIVPIGQVPREP